MSIPVRLEDGSMEYVVRHDIDGNGRDDDVIFDSEEYADQHESCYVMNDITACENIVDPIRIQLFTASGLPAKTCEYEDFNMPLTQVKFYIKKLADNLWKASDISIKSMADDLISIINVRPDSDRLTEIIAKYINIINDVDERGKLNARQIDLLARLLADHAGSIKNIIGGAVNLFGGDLNRSLFNLVTSQFETCVSVYGDSCMDDAVDMNSKELQEITRVFPGFANCTGELGSELSDDRVIRGVPCMKGSYVEFNENGTLAVATLGTEYKIGELTFKKGTRLKFNEEGVLESVVLSEDDVLNELSVSSLEPVNFDSDMKITSFRSSEEQTINDVPIQAGMRVEFGDFYRDPMNITFAAPREINGYPADTSNLRLGCDNNYNSDGKLINTYACKGGDCRNNLTYGSTYLSFYEQGQLRALSLAEDRLMNGIYIPEGSEVEFYKDGALKTIILSSPTTVSNVEMQKNDVILLEHDGQGMTAYLSSDRDINGVKYAKGAWIDFSVI